MDCKSGFTERAVALLLGLIEMNIKRESIDGYKEFLELELPNLGMLEDFNGFVDTKPKDKNFEESLIQKYITSGLVGSGWLPLKTFHPGAETENIVFFEDLADFLVACPDIRFMID